jgi:RsmE family RNA methyltransferase
MNLVLLEPSECAVDGRARLEDHRATHVLQVLRAGPGATLRVGIVDGPMGEATIESTEGGVVTIVCRFSAAPPRPRVDLLLALPRPKVMRRLWAQLAALGVGRIVLTNAERVERHYFDTHVLDAVTYRPLLVEGLQQARDTHLPLVSVHRQFRPLVEDELDGLCPSGDRLVADPAAARTIREAVGANAADRVLIAIGPEGGWNSFEMRLLEAHGFTAVGMGRRTLRTDTACVAILALVGDALRSSS